MRHTQGMLSMARGQYEAAHASFVDAERLADSLRAPHFLAAVARQWQLRAQLQLGDPAPARAALAGASGDAQWRSLAAHVHLADGDTTQAAAAVAPVLAGEAFSFHANQEIEALLLDALARKRAGDRAAAERSVERALDLAEPQGFAWIFMTVPGAAELLAAHPAHATAHAAFRQALLDLFDGGGAAAPELAEQLNERELTVLRFLPSNLSAAEIGSELFLSVNTVKTHMRKLYAKLEVHTRADAVERGRALGLLAPSRRG